MDTLVKINNIATSWMEGNYNGEDLPADLAKAAFAAMHDIYNLSKDGGWTPCSVALPVDNAKDDDGDDVRYLVTVKREYRSGYIGRYVCTAIYADVAWWSAETQSIIDDKETVIAWSQKPEPYRGGE